MPRLITSLPSDCILFPFFSEHYNAEGYKLVADKIYYRLLNDGIKPINSSN